MDNKSLKFIEFTEAKISNSGKKRKRALYECSCGDIREYLSEPKIVVDFKYDESLFQNNGTGIIPQLVLGSFEDGK